MKNVGERNSSWGGLRWGRAPPALLPHRCLIVTTVNWPHHNPHSSRCFYGRSLIPTATKQGKGYYSYFINKGINVSRASQVELILNPDKFVTKLKLMAQISWLPFSCSPSSLVFPQALRSYLLLLSVLCCFKPLTQSSLFPAQECPGPLIFACLVDNAHQFTLTSQAVHLLSEALPRPHSLLPSPRKTACFVLCLLDL